MQLINNNLDDKFNIGNPSESVSDKYRHLPDSYFLKPLLDRGFKIDRSEFKGNLGHRIMRLSHPELSIGSDKIQVVASNSHDGSKAFNLFLGVFRLVCSNGMIVGESFTENKSIKHIGGNFYEKVDDRVEELLKETDRLYDVVAKMKNTLILGDNDDFYNKAFRLRFKDDHKNNKLYKNLAVGLKPRRDADKHSDLWTTFNRVQEDLIRGGFSYRLDSKGVSSIRKAREITNIQDRITINQGLWDLAQSLVS